MNKERILKTLKRAAKLEKGKEIATAQEFEAIEDNLLNIDNKISVLSDSVDNKLDNLSEELKKKLEQELVLDFDEKELVSNISKSVEENLSPKIDVVTRETKKELLGIISDKQNDALLEVRQLANKKERAIENKLIEVDVAIDTIKSIEVRDGKDGKDGSPDTPKEIRDKLETLEGEDRLDAKAIKNLPESVNTIMAGAGGRLLSQMNDVDTTGLSQDKVLKWDATRSMWVTGTTGGGGGTWGSITGTLSDQTDLQTALNAKANLAGGNTFTGTQTLDTIQAGTSAGGVIRSNSGSAVAEFGAGGGQNWTFEGGVKLNGGTASRVLVTDSNKNIAYSTVTASELEDLPNKLSQTFETVNKNLKQYDYTINYSGDLVSNVVYSVGAGSITKTFNRTGDKVTSIVLSGDTPSGIDLTKTISYTGDLVTGIAYS